MRRLALILGATGVALLVAASAFALVFGTTPVADIALSLGLTTFPAIGALVASRHPRNPIGWLFCGAGLLFAVSGIAQVWAVHAYERPEPLPGGLAAAWLSSWAFLPAVFGVPQLLFLLFPTGRPLGPRWRAAVWLAVAAISLQGIGAAFASGPLQDVPIEGLQNPLGSKAGDAAEGLGWALSALSIPCATAALVVRFRRARGVERLQLKWFLLAAIAFTVCVLVAGALFMTEGHLPVAGQLLIVAAFTTIPVAAGVGILRHRLYDIDVVIRRTLVYGALTALLAGVYLGLVLLSGLAVGDSDLAVAASTLAVAALARPALRRIQEAVDRRFYRRRYDARQTLEDFGGRLRDELDLEALGADLRGVVRDTVQPAHVSLWLRGGR